MSAHNLKRAPAIGDLPLFSGAAESQSTGAAALRPGAYPHQPGSKSGGTSSQAADAIASEATLLRECVLAALREHGPATADEVAERIGKSPFATRPRLSELHKLGRIVATGERRRNRSGMTASVWAAA